MPLWVHLKVKELHGVCDSFFSFFIAGLCKYRQVVLAVNATVEVVFYRFEVLQTINSN